MINIKIETTEDQQVNLAHAINAIEKDGFDFFANTIGKRFISVNVGITEYDATADHLIRKVLDEFPESRVLSSWSDSNRRN